MYLAGDLSWAARFASTWWEGVHRDAEDILRGSQVGEVFTRQDPDPLEKEVPPPDEVVRQFFVFISKRERIPSFEEE